MPSSTTTYIGTSIVTLDETLVDYLATHYHHDYVLEILRTFEVLDLLGYENADAQFIELLSTYSYSTPDALSDAIITKLYEVIAQVLHEHDIELLPEAPLSLCHEVLSAIYLLQQLEDYRYLDELLSSELSPMELFCEAIKYVSVLSDEEILQCVTLPNDLFITALKNYVKERVQTQPSDEALDKALIENYRAFRDFCAPHRPLGVVLLEAGVRAGAEFDEYLMYLETIEATAQCALDILSLILLAQNAYRYPLVIWRRYAPMLVDSHEVRNRLDTMLVAILTDFEHSKGDTRV